MGKQKFRELTGLAEDHTPRKGPKLALHSRCRYFSESGALGFRSVLGFYGQVEGTSIEGKVMQGNEAIWGDRGGGEKGEQVG